MAADTDIRYVCLSDLHLGAELSLLTALKMDPDTGKLQIDPLNPSPVLEKLIDCLRFLIANQDQSPKPTLILLGDILELALANDNVAAMVFERFLELAMPAGGQLFERMVYIPGNHDHHLWESARETQYVQNYLAHTRPRDDLRIPWHTTHIFMDDDPNRQVPSFFLNGLVHRYDRLKNFNINTVYPNYGLRQDQRWVIFHHGHFVESIYTLMTTLKDLIFPSQPGQTALIRRVDDLEAENFAWIDFLWSTLGRSGKVGEDLEIIYDKMLVEKQFRELIENIATGLEAKYGWDSGWLGNELTKAIVGFLVHWLVNRESAQNGINPLSPDAETGLRDYVGGPLKIQIDEECENRHLYIPEEVTFVFGHTHKPFEKVYPYWPYLGDGVPVYNTGGWVVETEEPSPVHGGAVVLLNENLDAASLRLYNEAGNANDYLVRVADPPPGAADSEFHKNLHGLVEPGWKPWREFSDTVANEVQIRRDVLKAKIESSA